MTKEQYQAARRALSHLSDNHPEVVALHHARAAALGNKLNHSGAVPARVSDTFSQGHPFSVQKSPFE